MARSRTLTKAARVVAEALRQEGKDVSYQWVRTQVGELWEEAWHGTARGPGQRASAMLRLIELVDRRAK